MTNTVFNTQATTKTVRALAKFFGIPASGSYTDAPYVNDQDRTVVFRVDAARGAMMAEALNSALNDLGFTDTTARYTNTRGWGYVRVARAVIA